MNTENLAQRIAEGRMPIAEALGCAMQLGEALRRVHDAGQFHGAVTPAIITISAAGVDLLPAPAEPDAAITPYTAPEILSGRPADARSDIFSFGAVVFEMLTGRRAFEGEDRTALAASLAGPTPGSGSPAVDRMIAPCLSTNPETRTPRMQRVLMELRMVTVAARRAEAAAASAGRRDPGIDAATIRAEMQQMESRLAARLASHEETIAEVRRSVDEAIGELRDQLCTEIERIEQALEAARDRTAEFERSVAADLVDIEQGLKVQVASIESARTAMSQTDDLVERVVEALESLQTAVLDSGDAAGERTNLGVN